MRLRHVFAHPHGSSPAVEQAATGTGAGVERTPLRSQLATVPRTSQGPLVRHVRAAPGKLVPFEIAWVVDEGDLAVISRSWIGKRSGQLKGRAPRNGTHRPT